MADAIISALTPAASLNATDKFEIEQGTAPTNSSRYGTIQQILDLVTPLLEEAVTALSISSGAVTVDLALGNYFTLTLTENVTSITLDNLPAAGKARTFSIRFLQDGTGGRTVTFPSSFKFTDGSDFAVISTADAYTVFTASTFDQGTRWECTMKQGGV